ncbi:MAG: ubiquinone/menaquinone biosynthesis methyltransferase [bacterium]
MTATNKEKGNKLKLLKKVNFEKYFQAETWGEYNKAFFDNLALKYDASNAFHSFGTKQIIDKKVVEKIPLTKNAKVIDICAGSGDISIRIAQKYPDADITGIDVSENMLKVARKKSKKFDNITYLYADALNLPYEDNSFDVAVISFGLRNLENLEDGLKEMQRVVKSGGYVVNIDQGKPSNPVFKVLYEVYFYNIAPILGKLLFHIGEFNSFRYLPESNKFFPDQSELVSIFESLGFKDVKNYNYLLGAIAQQVTKVEK